MNSKKWEIGIEWAAGERTIEQSEEAQKFINEISTELNDEDNHVPETIVAVTIRRINS